MYVFWLTAQAKVLANSWHHLQGENIMIPDIELYQLFLRGAEMNWPPHRSDQMQTQKQNKCYGRDMTFLLYYSIYFNIIELYPNKKNRFVT